MKKIITIFGMVTMSLAAQAQDTCKLKLENMALAAFDASIFREADMPVVAEANMSTRYKAVTIYQYKAQYEITYQLKNDDTALCDVMGSTEIKEVLN